MAQAEDDDHVAEPVVKSMDAPLNDKVNTPHTITLGFVFCNFTLLLISLGA